MPTSQEIAIRDCLSLEDYEQCVFLQKAVWDFADRDLIPLRFFVVARKIEGQVIGAFEPGGRMVGFCFAVPALRGATVYLHSHMLAVLAPYRRAGLGRRLKLEQRRQALARGITLIEWTFDPLEWKNALFNLSRLGAIARRYVPNQYGISTSPLHRGLPTDRLIAEWWLDSPRAVACAQGGANVPSPIQHGIPISLDILEASQENRLSIADLQSRLRDDLQKAFASGLAAMGFEVTGRTGHYLLGPWGGTG
jgi:predicted GNAT superfamily acetyltransferase